jgi:hypothetical protein
MSPVVEMSPVVGVRTVLEVKPVQQDRAAGAPAAGKRQVIIQMLTRLVLAQATLAAAVGLFYSRRHLPSVVITMLLVAVLCALAFVVRSGTHTAWVVALSVESAFVLFGLSRFFAARYVGGTLFAIIVSGALLHPAVASAYPAASAADEEIVGEAGLEERGFGPA